MFLVGIRKVTENRFPVLGCVSGARDRIHPQLIHVARSRVHPPLVQETISTSVSERHRDICIDLPVNWLLCHVTHYVTKLSQAVQMDV